jgi:hypothetical protein
MVNVETFRAAFVAAYALNFNVDTGMQYVKSAVDLEMSFFEQGIGQRWNVMVEQHTDLEYVGVFAVGPPLKNEYRAKFYLDFYYKTQQGIFGSNDYAYESANKLLGFERWLQDRMMVYVDAYALPVAAAYTATEFSCESVEREVTQNDRLIRVRLRLILKFHET